MRAVALATCPARCVRRGSSRESSYAGDPYLDACTPIVSAACTTRLAASWNVERPSPRPVMRAADRQPSEHDHRNGVRHVSPESSGGRIGRHCADSQDAALHLRQQDLAQLAHVHRTTVAEAPTNAKLQHFMRDTLRVLSASMAVAGDVTAPSTGIATPRFPSSSTRPPSNWSRPARPTPSSPTCCRLSPARPDDPDSARAVTRRSTARSRRGGRTPRKAVLVPLRQAGERPVEVRSTAQ